MSATLTRDQIARMIADDIPEGSFVNLGIGQPTLVAGSAVRLAQAYAVGAELQDAVVGVGPGDAGDAGQRVGALRHELG